MEKQDKIFINETDTFQFGKYRGETIIDIIEKHPKYINWCFDEIEGFMLAPELMEYYQEIIHELYEEEELYNDSYEAFDYMWK